MPNTIHSRIAAANLQRAIAAGRDGAQKALTKVAARVVADAAASLSSPAAPSAPGTPPARRTGLLQSGVRFDVRRGRASGNPYVLVGLAGPHAHVGRMLEYGTSRIPSRPFIRPAVNRAAPTVTPTVAREWAAGVQKEARGK
jgi:HK97 gp10 family phage protein